MSGIEIIGLVLGVLPLLIAALEKGKERWSTVRTFTRKWKVELDCLVRCLKEQRWLFKNSTMILLGAAGEDLTSRDPSESLAKPDVRRRITAYLQDADTLEFFDSIVHGYEASLTALIERLGHIHNGPQTKYDIGAVIAANLPKDGRFYFDKRFEFTMKHSEMRREIDNLDRCNEKLKGLIDRIHALNRTKARDLTKEQAARTLAKDLHDIRHRAIGLHAAIEACWQQGCQPIHTFMLILECRSAFGQNSATGKKVRFHSLLACGDTAKFLQKQCREAFISFDAGAAATSQQAVSDLCTNLAKAVSTGEAIALTMDQQYQLFCDIAQQKPHFDFRTVQESVSLEQVLMDCIHLSPQQRTQLGIDIASSLLQLQTTPWLGSSWTNKVIRFVQYNVGGQQLVECQKPFIARAFPDAGPVHTDNHVKHDALELGILLLEVWNLKTFEFWASSNNIELKPGYYSRMTPAIQWLVESESNFMTPSYIDAVSVCVRFSFEGVPHRWEHPEFRRAFCEKVLGSLQENRKAWIRS